MHKAANQLKIVLQSFFVIILFLTFSTSIVSAGAAISPFSVEDAYTVSLLHMNGTDGAQAFADESGKIWTAAGNA